MSLCKFVYWFELIFQVSNVAHWPLHCLLVHDGQSNYRSIDEQKRPFKEVCEFENMKFWSSEEGGGRWVLKSLSRNKLYDWK